MKKNIFKDSIQKVVDKVDGKIVDISSMILMIIDLILVMKLFISTLDIISSPILNIHSPIFYSVLFIISFGIFFYSMLGDKLNKPNKRPKIFLFTAITLSILTYSLLAEIFNYGFTSILNNILSVSEIPIYLINTNVRIVTIVFPLLIVVLVFGKSFTIPFKEEYKKEIYEYSLDILTRNIDKITPYTVDIKICEDMKTGEPIVLTEKNSFRHRMIIGSSGSGKTALSIRPDLAQLFSKKAFFKEELKRLAFEALEEGICFLNVPITDKYINENFSMDLISFYPNKKDEFMKKFKNFIVGVRDNKYKLYSGKCSFSDSNEIKIDIPINDKFSSNIKINIKVFKNAMIYDEADFSFDEKNGINKKNKNFIIYSQIQDYKKVTQKEVEKDKIDLVEESIFKEIDGILYSKFLSIKLIKKSNEDLSFKVNVDSNGDGKIIYRDLGVTVIAPDGGLASEAINIASKNGVKVNKIDPKMEEIEKGNVAKFNPMMVGSPEKAGDILSSILTTMEQSAGKDANPYFTNASIRAIRNVVIILRVAHPLIYNENPTLVDVLNILNNFNLVTDYVKKLEEDSYLEKRWKSVIDYFKTSFYPPIKSEGKGGYEVLDGDLQSQGRKTKKTEEAIGGIINQLDNFLGREEIKYIFCDRNNSLDLAQVLEKGECIAVATRQSELGDVLGKAFALMIILSLQNAVLGRFSEDENPEIPYFLFIDEFPFYINDNSKVFFTFSRKYKCSVTIAIQNLGQLEEAGETFRQAIFTNCSTKLVLPGANVEDRDYFCKFFGVEEVVDIQTSISQTPVLSENNRYNESIKGGLVEKNKISEQELAELQFKRCYYATIDQKGRNIVGKGFMDFLKLSEKNTIETKRYPFSKYNKKIKEKTYNNLEDDINSMEKNINVKKKEFSENTKNTSFHIDDDTLLADLLKTSKPMLETEKVNTSSNELKGKFEEEDGYIELGNNSNEDSNIFSSNELKSNFEEENDYIELGNNSNEEEYIFTIDENEMKGFLK